MRALLIRLSATLVTVLAVHPAAAEVTGCEIPDGIAYARPSEEITEVRLRMILVGLHGISETSQTFSADLIAIGAWHDPRLAAEALGHSLEGCRLDASRIWNPRMQVLNLRNAEFPLSEIEVDRDGGVVRRTRMIGEFGIPMDLRDYPFDRQTLKISVVSLY